MTAQTAREKLAQLEAETKELTAKKNAIRAEVLAELKSDIATFGFTAAELFETPKPAKTKGNFSKPIRSLPDPRSLTRPLP